MSDWKRPARRARLVQRRRWLVVAVAGLMAAACSSAARASGTASTNAPRSSFTVSTGPAPWPAPSDPLGRARAAGLVPQAFETLRHHVHAHLDVFVNGVPVIVPAGIGINTDDPGVHRFVTKGQPAFGGISPPCDTACISPLHTHDVTGVLHTESPTDVDNTLGQFFTEWGVRLDAKCIGGYCKPAWQIAIYVNGHSIGADLAQSIALTNKKEIAVIIGTPPAQIPVAGDFSTA